MDDFDLKILHTSLMELQEENEDPDIDYAFNVILDYIEKRVGRND